MSPTPAPTVSNDALSALSESSRACIERLCKYEPECHEVTSPNQYVLGAVLVLLYERPGGRGGLRVLLTTRSKELRSHPGQTALPGGKVDKTDAGVVETAVSIIHPSNFCPPLHYYSIIVYARS